MTQTNIVNVINFIRALEPRVPDRDLLEPVLRQIEIVKRHKIPATWLIQYDAMLEDRFTEPLLALDKNHEIGAWFEVVEPWAQDADIPWRGRFPWDWHSDVGFTIGYTPQQRERLADVFMAKFKQRFGTYPKSVGSWFIDAHMLQYLYDTYGVTASCNCKDQWGTDGYSLWGGYFNQAYYPSKLNSYMPAQRPDMQIPIPIFRMLGSDPIYQYDFGLGQGTDGTATDCQQVVSLEPAYPDGGGNEQWINWFCDVNFRAPALSFGYAQAGQENAFGWPAIAKGFTLQMELFARLAKTGEIRLETLADSAQWFRKTYPVTPASAVTAMKDSPQGSGDHKTVWYCSRFYRANLFWQGSAFWLRDIHRFDESVEERYLHQPCTTHACCYDALPMVDGFRWSTADTRAKLELVFINDDGSCTPIISQNPKVNEYDQSLVVEWTNPQPVSLRLDSRSLHIQVHTQSHWGLRLMWSPQTGSALEDIADGKIIYRYEGRRYELPIPNTAIRRCDDTTIEITPTQPEQTVTLYFDGAAQSPNLAQKTIPTLK